MPLRVIFNFLGSCNMRCRFCYCPAGQHTDDDATMRRIIDIVAQWNVATLTFGGGDPFLYKGFPTLLSHARHRLGPACVLHVDTNGLQFPREQLCFLESTIDLLGLPLDGSTAEVHSAMRPVPGHYETVLTLLGSLSSTRIALKVNTVVSRKNAHDLESMAKMLNALRIAVWSLYQFWPLGPNALLNIDEFLVSEAEVRDAASVAARVAPRVHVEVGTVSDRWHSYFFVTQDGLAYTVDAEDSSRYVWLGSVFDAEVLNRWRMHFRNTANLRLNERLRFVRTH